MGAVSWAHLHEKHSYETYMKCFLYLCLNPHQLIMEEKRGAHIHENTVKEILYYDGDVWRMCSTHRDHPVAHTQCAVSVCCSTFCDARDVDSLKTDDTLSNVYVLCT